MLKAHIRSEKKYMERHPNSSVSKKIGNAYDFFYAILFHETLRDYYNDNEGLLFPRDSKAILEKYFNIDLTV